MATHFKGPILFSAQRAMFENLNIARWNDQFIQFDDFDHGALDETLRFTIVKDSGAAAAIVADARSGELNLTSANTTDNDGASVSDSASVTVINTAPEFDVSASIEPSTGVVTGSELTCSATASDADDGSLVAVQLECQHVHCRCLLHDCAQLGGNWIELSKVNLADVDV